MPLLIGIVIGIVFNQTALSKQIVANGIAAYDARFHHPQIAPEGSDTYSDLDRQGVSGRVIGQDGRVATIERGHARYRVTNLSDRQLDALKPGERITIRPTDGGRVEIDTADPGAPGPAESP